MKNPWLKQLLASVVDDPAIAPKLKRAPAAMTMHHAYLGGLLEHIVSLIGLAADVSAHYPRTRRGLAARGRGAARYRQNSTSCATLAPSIIRPKGGCSGTSRIGVALVREKIKAIPGFPAPLGVLVEHLILSHHGSYEFGSPALPQIPRSAGAAFHRRHGFEDGGSARDARIPTGGEEIWTERNPSLRRSLLRTKPFLNDNGPDAATTATLPFGDAKDVGKKMSLPLDETI